MDSKEVFDVDCAIRNLVELVESNLQKVCENTEHLFEWLTDFQAKAKQRLECPAQEFKMPKTPALKRTRLQKKRVFQQEDDHNNETDKVHAAPTKKEKLSFEEDDLRESIGISRPRRQASCAAKSKIQHSLKMMNCTQKLRRPSNDQTADLLNSSAVIEIKDKEGTYSQNLKAAPSRSKASVMRAVEPMDEPVTSKVPKAVRIAQTETVPAHSEVELMEEDVPAEPVVAKEAVVEIVEKPKRTRPTRKGKKAEESAPGAPSVRDQSDTSDAAPAAASVTAEVMEEGASFAAPPAEPVKVEVEKPKRTRPGPRSRKAEEAVEEVVHQVVVPDSPSAAPLTSPPPIPSAPQASSTPEKGVLEKVLPTVVPEPVEIEEEKPKRIKPGVKGRKEPEEAADTDEVVVHPKQVEDDIEKPKRTRPAPKSKKTSDVVAVVSSATISEAESTTIDGDAVPKKRGRKAKPAAATEDTSSPRITRHRPVELVQITATETAVKQVAKPAVSRATFVSTPSKKTSALEQTKTTSQFQSPSSASPIRKHFTPKLIFSPFKASSVKTKVEAFEAALSGTAAGVVDDETSDQQGAVLPEARVLVRRLTKDDLHSVGVHGQSPQLPAKRGTFVKQVEEVDSAPRSVPEMKSVTQTLARKSLEKAKKLALSVAKQNFLSSTLQEGSESPNVHVNRNAVNILSKYRFTNTSGSSGSSSSHVRHVAMTQARAAANAGTSTSSLIPKPMAPVVTKVSEDEELRLKEEKLARLRAKEEEAARKREEINKAKAEEQKRKHDARAKRAMEQRALRAKRCEEEQKQKLETKEEKSNLIKMEMLAKNQEKAEKIKAELLKKQQEAEQRRKEEAAQKQREREMQKQREKEEEQLRLLAAKKEQEEQEKLAKMRQAEAEKAKAAATAAAAAAEKAKLNTTVTLPTSNMNNYQITPVRVHKTGKLVVNPDNYDITDMRSDDSTDDDSRPKKTIPSWARSANLKVALSHQASADINTDGLFPPDELLLDPNLNAIFPIKRPRFDKRTSSAVWKTPPANYM